MTLRWCRTGCARATPSAGRVLESLEAALARRARTCATCTWSMRRSAPRQLARLALFSELHCAHCNLSIASRCRARSSSTPRSARARPAAASAAPSASTTASSCRTREVAARQCTQALAEQVLRRLPTDLEKFAQRRGDSTRRAVARAPAEARRWVIEGEGPWTRKVLVRVERFFAWLDRAYGVPVSGAAVACRAYTPCEACGGAPWSRALLARRPRRAHRPRPRSGARLPARAVSRRARGGRRASGLSVRRSDAAAAALPSRAARPAAAAR